MAFQNIIFDVGNVLLRWDPHFIVTQTFKETSDPAQLVQTIFKHQTWLDLNLGLLSEQEALVEYQTRLGIEMARLEEMMETVRESLQPLPGSLELLHALNNARYNLYALTDNTKGIIAYLTQKYHFWPIFQGIVVSANVGHLKPAREIYEHLLNTYALSAAETIFIDDHLPNVLGAQAVGIEAILFENAKQCQDDLRKLQIRF